MPNLRTLLLQIASVFLVLDGTLAAAQQYPTKPIRLVVPFAPGGSNDIIGRSIATPLSEILGKQVIIENRAGAGAVVGTEIVANAPKNGYTLLVNSLSHTTNPSLYKLPFDPIHSFTPVAMIASGPIVLVVNPALEAKSVAELVALAQAKPGQLQFASAGIGSFTHLGAELFKVEAKVDLLHVPFRGGGPAIIDVVGGHTKINFANLLTAMPHIRSGKVRALGVGGRTRTTMLPDVPTIAEAGVPTYEAVNWWGVMAPAGTPEPILVRLNAALTAVQANAELQQRLANEGAVVVKMSREDFGKFIQTEIVKWERVIKAGDIKAQ